MEKAAELKLLGFWVSPMVLRVEWAFMLKGITDYEYLDEDLLHNKSSLLLQLNPVHKKVPVLIHKGKAIAESLVIVGYIEETWKNHPLLPQDPYEKARIKSFAMFAEKVTHIIHHYNYCMFRLVTETRTELARDMCLLKKI